jgi:hypothetical protein
VPNGKEEVWDRQDKEEYGAERDARDSLVGVLDRLLEKNPERRLSVWDVLKPEEVCWWAERYGETLPSCVWEKKAEEVSTTSHMVLKAAGKKIEGRTEVGSAEGRGCEEEVGFTDGSIEAIRRRVNTPFELTEEGANENTVLSFFLTDSTNSPFVDDPFIFPHVMVETGSWRKLWTICLSRTLTICGVCSLRMS